MMDWSVLHQSCSVFLHVCVLVSNGPCLLGEHQNQQLWQYQREVLSNTAHSGGVWDKGDTSKPGWWWNGPKPTRITQRSHSWIKVNIGVLTKRWWNWVWIGRPRSITPTDLDPKKKKHSNVSKVGLAAKCYKNSKPFPTSHQSQSFKKEKAGIMNQI